MKVELDFGEGYETIMLEAKSDEHAVELKKVPSLHKRAHRAESWTVEEMQAGLNALLDAGVNHTSSPGYRFLESELEKRKREN